MNARNDPLATSASVFTPISFARCQTQPQFNALNKFPLNTRTWKNIDTIIYTVTFEYEMIATKRKDIHCYHDFWEEICNVIEPTDIIFTSRGNVCSSRFDYDRSKAGIIISRWYFLPYTVDNEEYKYFFESVKKHSSLKGLVNKKLVNIRIGKIVQEIDKSLPKN